MCWNDGDKADLCWLALGEVQRLAVTVTVTPSGRITARSDRGSRYHFNADGTPRPGDAGNWLEKKG